MDDFTPARLGDADIEAEIAWERVPPSTLRVILQLQSDLAEAHEAVRAAATIGVKIMPERWRINYRAAIRRATQPAAQTKTEGG